MQFFIQLIKALGIGLLTLLSIPVFFALLIFLPELCTRKTDSATLIKSESFQHLHHLITQLDSTKNIAVLPKNEYIVVDGLVINLEKRTFGNEPDLGFYQTYYDEANRNKFSRLDSLLQQRNIDSARVSRIITAMKTTDIADIAINKQAIFYRWKVSAMYGEEGFLYSKKKVSNDSLHYNVLENIAPDFYHFAR
ncbi:hypothetical protein [Spirosoma sp. KNUC1025]|uniref:hypothetical protein n=1 Tax=Spirosoma sp. KNUC1025 TaxID=2894082 RepID=UPI003863D60C|nr:hypothetical protein LN737_16585 [Spirosoma sp. KNUC1025]